MWCKVSFYTLTVCPERFLRTVLLKMMKVTGGSDSYVYISLKSLTNLASKVYTQGTRGGSFFVQVEIVSASS